MSTRLGARCPMQGIDWEHLREGEAPAFVAVETDSVGSASSSFDWELQVR